MAYRVDLPHFTNHMERFFSKVNQHVKAYFTIQLGDLIKLQRQKEEEYYAKVEMSGTLRGTTYSEEMSIELGMTTRWVAAAMKTQYHVVVNTDNSKLYTFAEGGDFVIVRSKDRIRASEGGLGV
ncbi:LOW QUALITY PROTEIN: hypothetical protein PHPALM_28073 [Phytophthora palmivora]|uniref:Uncharacterized protein n=1 Tax=Phytophthora palmivora TaxID=4796 RepID=A0A2P4XAZ8_9STRA|nr:LOW QUALITY PROTEIN: hypothetical protein PHPALM_28073 [Phytophthora palmivora]